MVSPTDHAKVLRQGHVGHRATEARRESTKCSAEGLVKRLTPERVGMSMRRRAICTLEMPMTPTAHHLRCYGLPMDQPARAYGLRNRVTEELESRIFSGAYPASSMLPPERSLAIELGVSRNIVREALKELGERGLITAEQGRGTFVTRPEDTTASTGAMSRALYRRGATPRDLIEGRTTLEGRLAELAAARTSEGFVHALHQAEAAILGASGVRERARADLALHRIIAKEPGNPVLLVMFESIESFTFDVMMRSHSDQSLSNDPDARHSSIVDAIAAGDSEAAGNAMRRHIRVAERRYGADLDKPTGDLARSLI